MSIANQTPMMAQWFACKEAAPDAILFFRLGDFYEAFYEDAELISKELDLTLTKRQEIPMAGIPHHICETYIDRLVAKGYRVAIAEQMENPKETKGIVKREIVRIVTPGTVINSTLLQDKEASYLASIVQLNQSWGLAYLDITTADFVVIEFEKKEALLDELARVCPKELILSKKWKEEKEFLREIKASIHYLEGWHFDHESSLEFLKKHFKVHSLDGFGLKGFVSGITAAGALLTYVNEELSLPIEHILTLRTHSNSAYMLIDKNSQRNLELSQLLDLLDATKTPMGGRLFRNWLLHPLLSVEKIKERQNRIRTFTSDLSKLLELRRHLSEVRDLERLMMRIETGFASPRDLAGLRFSLQQIPLITPLVSDTIPQTSFIADKLSCAIVDNPPLRLSDGGLFKKGYDPELDDLQSIKNESEMWMAAYQTRLRESSGIKTLKVGYTRAFGYYIEVSRGQNDKVPPSFHRRQTLVNADRFTTEELKEFEYKILSADEKISAIEARLFNELRGEIATHASLVRETAKVIAHIDCLAALAKVALERDYICPDITDSPLFDIEQGRHPVIEASLKMETSSPTTSSSMVRPTPGPHHRTQYGRQIDLYPPSRPHRHPGADGLLRPRQKRRTSASVDKVFTRIGASDDLARGQSTFMVEMTETANILNNATDRSLVILDEIGRGTSTYDGISIAWAVAEYLLSTPAKQAKTLFATHYWELTELDEKYPAAINLNVAVEETADGHRLLPQNRPGAADKSYGIHVAKLAGLPASALRLAEKKSARARKRGAALKKPTKQLDLFAEAHQSSPARKTGCSRPKSAHPLRSPTTSDCNGKVRPQTARALPPGAGRLSHEK